MLQVQPAQADHSGQRKGAAQGVGRQVDDLQAFAIAERLRLRRIEGDAVVEEVQFTQHVQLRQILRQLGEAIVGEFKEAQPGKRAEKLGWNFPQPHTPERKLSDMLKAHPLR
ncbi:hypothetical protein D3C77_353650 [compost metagenome]